MSHSLVRSASLLVVSALLAWAGLFATESTARAQTNDPIIIAQPNGGATALGEEWAFEVKALGTPPLAYQWYLNDVRIARATNSTYTIQTVTNSSAGTYTVVITNTVGRATSDPATLTLSENPPRVILNGNITSAGKVRVPMLFSGNGQESSVSFSLQFDPNVLTNPGWENRGTNAITGTNAFELNVTQSSNGLVGVTVSRPGHFPAQAYELGNFTFDLLPTNSPFTAMLQFTNTPTASEARPGNGVSMGLQAAIVPQVDLVDAAPFLDRQSGLVQQRIMISYPGALSITNVDVAAGNLGEDSLTNRVTLFNGIGVKSVPVDTYGNQELLPYVSAHDFGPGTQRLLTMEYYVSDKLTVPLPVYHLDLGEINIFTVPNAVTPLSITTNRFYNGTYVIQFPTVGNFLYYVQYAETVDDLVNYGPTSKIVGPPITGTGFSVQWIDNGPPKTISRPTDGTRFYRVLELPVNN